MKMKENLKESCYLLFLFFCLSLFQAKTVFSNDDDLKKAHEMMLKAQDKAREYLKIKDQKNLQNHSQERERERERESKLFCEDIKAIDFHAEPNHILSKTNFINSETIRIIEAHPELFSKKLRTITQKKSFLQRLYTQLYVEFNKEMRSIAKEKNLSIYEMVLGSEDMYDEAFSKASEKILNGEIGTNGMDNLSQIFSALDNDIYYSLYRKIKADSRKQLMAQLHLENEANEIKNIVRENILPLIKIKIHQTLNYYDRSHYAIFFSDSLDGSKSFFTQKLIHDLEEDFSWAIEDIYAKSNCDLLETIYSQLLERKKVALQKALNYVRTRPVAETSYKYSSFAETEQEIEQRIKNYIQFQLYVVSDMLTEEKKYTRSTGEDSYRIVETRINNLININQERRDPEFAYELYLKALFKKKDINSDFKIDGYANQMRRTNEHFFGIGVRLKPTNEGNLEVLEVLKNPNKKGKKYPSERAGIKEGDVLIAVKESENSDWYNLSQISFSKAIEKIRGPENTFIYLKVKRPDKENLLLLKAKRGKIKKSSSIQHFIVDVMRGNKKHKVALITFRDFTANSLYKNFKNILSTLRDEKVESLVIDLTRNPGGLIDTAADLTGLFMENSILVKSNLRKGEKGRKLKDPDPSIQWKKPLVVLTGTDTASASEIMAGSLKVYRRAIVVGDRTYGKGTVQVQVPYFQRATVTLTVAFYILPDGSSPQQIGIKPDISFPTLSFYFQTNESKLTYWGNEESFMSVPEETGAGTSWTPVTQEMLSKLKIASKERVTKNEKEFSYLVDKLSLSEEKKPKEYQVNYEKTKPKKELINYLERPDIKEALEIATDAISIVK